MFARPLASSVLHMMAETSGATHRAATRRRRLRSWWRHEQQSIAAALATFVHQSAQRQKTARPGTRHEVKLHGQVPGESSSSSGGQAPSTLPWTSMRCLSPVDPDQTGWHLYLVHRAGSAAQRGADRGDRAFGADPRCSCAADGWRRGGSSWEPLSSRAVLPRALCGFLSLTCLSLSRSGGARRGGPQLVHSFLAYAHAGQVALHGRAHARLHGHRQPRAVYKYWAPC